MQAALLPAALLSSEFRFITVNAPLAELVRSTTGQLRRHGLFDIVDPRDREGVRSFAESASSLRVLALCQREMRILCGDETRNALLVMRKSGSAGSVRYLANIVDLSEVATTDSERETLLARIEEVASEWRTTFDAVETPIVIVGGDATIVRMNRAARMLAGRAYNEVVGHALREVAPGEPWHSMTDLAIQVQEKRVPAARQVRDLSGRTLDILAMSFDASNESDARVIQIVWDVSALVDLQTRLDQQKQMATMGALVAGVAHEVRNPLFAISATIDALEQTADDANHEYFEVLREEIDRMTKLMQDLLAYGRPAAPVFATVEVKDIVEQAARACSAVASKQRVDIVVTSVDGLTLIADRDRIVRAVENLVLNAVQHSPEGSTVRVDAFSRTEARSRLLTIAVRDSGAGFAPDDVGRIFEPFFSRRSGGTGLGLALVHQIVTEHGGTVTAGNASSGGGEVVIEIPLRGHDAA